MKNVILTFLVFCLVIPVFAQSDGQIIKEELYTLPDSLATKINKIKESDSPLKEVANKIVDVKYSRITYMSDGLKVIAYIAEPKKEGKYPCLILNRGGNRDFGQITPGHLAFWLGVRASWDYVVVASQYRGVDGGEGIEEFGGKDINDVLNLIPVLEQLPKADTYRIGIEGGSRGGMMTYLALKNSCRFKAAVSEYGMANAFKNIDSRPEMEKHVFSELIPNYWDNKDEELKKRSAVFWADQMCKTTPLLILHGSSDWRVLPEESLELVNNLYKNKHPVRFKFYEGADHGLSEFWLNSNDEIKSFFDYYVRDENKLPNMEPHGN